MSAESCESFSSLNSVVKVGGVAKHGDKIDPSVQAKAKASQGQNMPNNLILGLKGQVKEEKNSADLDVFDFPSSSDESKHMQEPFKSKAEVNREVVNKVVNIGLGQRVALAKKLKMKPFPLSGIQVFKQVRVVQIIKLISISMLSDLFNGQSLLTFFATFLFSGSTSVL